MSSWTPPAPVVLVDPAAFVVTAALAELLAVHRGGWYASPRTAEGDSDVEHTPRGGVVPPPVPPMLLHMTFADVATLLLRQVQPHMRVWFLSALAAGDDLTRCDRPFASHTEERGFTARITALVQQAATCSLTEARQRAARVVGRTLMNTRVIPYSRELLDGVVPLLQPDVPAAAMIGAAHAVRWCVTAGHAGGLDDVHVAWLCSAACHSNQCVRSKACVALGSIATSRAAVHLSAALRRYDALGCVTLTTEADDTDLPRQIACSQVVCCTDIFSTLDVTRAVPWLAERVVVDGRDGFDAVRAANDVAAALRHVCSYASAEVWVEALRMPHVATRLAGAFHGATSTHAAHAADGVTQALRRCVTLDPSLEVLLRGDGLGALL